MEFIVYPISRRRLDLRRPGRYCPPLAFTHTPAAVLIRVVASVIEIAGKLLLCQRPPHKRHGGLWEFPGGKVEPGESDFAAVERELAEEMGVQVVEVGAVELSVQDPGSDFVIEFLPVAIQGEPRALEHVAVAWVAEEDLVELALAPSDQRYARHRVGASAGEVAE